MRTGDLSSPATVTFGITSDGATDGADFESTPLESDFNAAPDPVISGLSEPIAFEFLATDTSKLFVAEKRGTIQVY